MFKNLGYDIFRDSSSTISFIPKIYDLIDSINSNTKKFSLQADINSYSNKVKIYMIAIFKRAH